MGFVAIWERLAALDAPALLRRTLPAVTTLALALAVGINLWIYFVRMPGDPRVISKFQYAGETRAGLLIATTHAHTPNLATYVPKPFTSDEVLVFMTDGAPVAALPDDPAALPTGPVLIVVPRAEGQDFAQQTAAARRLAAAAGLHENPRRPPTGWRRPGLRRVRARCAIAQKSSRAARRGGEQTRRAAVIQQTDSNEGRASRSSAWYSGMWPIRSHRTRPAYTAALPAPAANLPAWMSIRLAAPLHARQ